MKLRFIPAHPRRVGATFLVLGILGTLARNYLGVLKDMEHGNLADFSLGLLFGLGVALCFLTDSQDSEDIPSSIRTS